MACTTDNVVVIRPPDTSWRTYVSPRIFLLSSFFLSPFNLRARWTELNGNWSHVRKYVQFENAYPKSVVSLPPTNLGPKNLLFGRTHNLTATLTAYISSERNIIYKIWQVHWQLQGIAYIASKRHELWSTNGFKLEGHFTHPPKLLRFSSLPGFTHALQTTELNQTLSHGRR